MTTTTSRETELPLAADEATPLTDELAEPTEPEQGEPSEEQIAAEAMRASPRLAIGIAFPVIGAGVMLGGIFTGVSPRIYAVLSGLMGIGLAILAARITKPMRSTAVIAVGLFAIGVIMVLPAGLDKVFDLRRLIAEASQAGDLLRPPVPFVTGWRAVVGWVMGAVGFQTTWVAVSMRRPIFALLLPLPIAAIAGISLPEVAQIPSGLALLALFALGLGVIATGEVSAEEEEVPVSYQLRKLARGVPLIALVTFAVYLLSRTGFLFPDPIIDPEQEAQKPKPIPLTEVEDRVLFEVDSSVSGPWRIGSLDVYDGEDWRLPPFADSQIEEIPKSGLVDPDLDPAVKAVFTIAGLGGTVLPTLPNSVGIISRGPLLAYDSRNANIRVVEGQVQPGLSYTVTSAGLPTIDDLKALNEPFPEDLHQFTDIGRAPPAVQDLISQAPKTSKWEEFDFLRTYLLDNVTVTGVGTPKSITPERVADMIAGSKEGSPFEIVAAQAMMGRWVGVPSRIGYGFDGGELVGKLLQVRPAHGSAFVEVYFPRYKWLPVIGVPKKAKASATTSQQRVDPTILPSEDIGVKLIFPVETPAQGVLGEQVRRVLLIVVPILLFLTLAYFTYPGIRKGLIRARRRTKARAEGPSARIAHAYAEWRDVAADLGAYHPEDTPFIFLSRFPPDEEHFELAWLTTRALWGDLRTNATEELALHAEELSRSLRKRMSAAQPATIRTVAAVSRLSLRHPYKEERHKADRHKADRKKERIRVPVG